MISRNLKETVQKCIYFAVISNTSKQNYLVFHIITNNGHLYIIKFAIIYTLLVIHVITGHRPVTTKTTGEQ